MKVLYRWKLIVRKNVLNNTTLGEVTIMTRHFQGLRMPGVR